MRVAQLTFESTTTMTQSEFAVWLGERDASDVAHYELLNGRVVMNPPAGYPHGLVEAQVLRRVLEFVGERDDLRVMGSSQGFELPSGDTVEPDCSVVFAERWDAMPAPPEGKLLRVVPDLVVEIRSPTTATRDRGEKRAIYERNGVREYWLVDPNAREVVVLSATQGSFDGGRTYGDGDTLVSTVLAGLTFDITALWPRR